MLTYTQAERRMYRWVHSELKSYENHLMGANLIAS